MFRGKQKTLRWKLGDINLLLGVPLEEDEIFKIAESISEKS